MGVIGEMRSYLLEKASGSVSKEALKNAPDNQPVVGVRFGRTSQSIYYYALAALRPCITAETADAFDADYGELLKSTKIPYNERQESIKRYRGEASPALEVFGLQLRKPLNGLYDIDLFWLPSKSIETTPLLFGNNVVSTSNQILKGLSRGQVYYRHENYYSHNDVDAQPIRITVLNLFKKGTRPHALIDQLQSGLKRYGFNSSLLSNDLEPSNLPDTQDPAGRAQLDQLLNDLMVVPTDIFFVFLPTDDRGADNSESGSLYHRIYSKLLRRGIASQFIYEDTLQNAREPRYLLNQIIPGVLAKLGNQPFILAEPLRIADCFLGLDVARVAKQRLAGSMNTCAGVCLYGSQGQFMHARTEGAVVEGEEIPPRFLELLLPANELRGKTVLIYRDGWFRGQEVTNLLNWASAIDANFILVECVKSGVPRLYEWNYKTRLTDAGRTTIYASNLSAPSRGLALCLSDREGILVTTKVSERVGLSRPLRLRVRAEGHQVHINDVLDATLKLTLLHHGALKPPRLPMVLHGAHRLADLRLNGVFFGEASRQFWL